MERVISLSGERGAGKDDAAAYLVEALRGMGVKVCKISFAEALYQEIANAYGVSIERLQARDEKESPQQYLTLENCKDLDFVSIAAPYLKKLRGSEVDLATPLSPREILKTWGNGYRRESAFGHENYFVNKVRDLITQKKDWVFVVSDTRQDNEFEALGYGLPTKETRFLRINRSDMINDDHQLLQGGHPTDIDWRRKAFDEVVLNPFNQIEQFKEKLVGIGAGLYGGLKKGVSTQLGPN